MSKVVLFGVGSLPQLVHFFLTHDSDHEVVAFTAHQQRIRETTFCGLPVVPFETLDQHYPPDQFEMFIALGYAQVNRVRAKVYHEAKMRGYQLISYVSSRATNWSQQMGDNCFIFENTTVQPFVTLGSNIIIWSGSFVGHHSTIEDHCYIAPRAAISGHVHVGAYTFIGTNATLRDSIRVGQSCVIGAGALLSHSAEDRQVYVGQQTPVYHKSSDEIDLLKPPDKTSS